MQTNSGLGTPAPMRVELSKEYGFEAAHRLPHAPPDHKCRRMHGHSYRIEVSIAGDVDERAGWLQDFADITAVVKPLLERQLDHRPPNDAPGLGDPAARLPRAGRATRRRPGPP